MFSTDSTPAECEMCVCTSIRVVYLWAGGGYAWLVCPWAINLAGCVIGRNGLRWAFNPISAMKKTEDRQWWSKKTRQWYPSAWVGETASSPPPLSLTHPYTHTKLFAFRNKLINSLHNVSHDVTGVPTFLFTVFMFPDLTDVSWAVRQWVVTMVTNPVARLDGFLLVSSTVCMTHHQWSSILSAKGLVWLQAMVLAKYEAYLIADWRPRCTETTSGIKCDSSPIWIERKPGATPALCGNDRRALLYIISISLELCTLMYA